MAVIQLSDDDKNSGSWIWSPIELSEELVQEVVSTAGPPKFIVSPNKIHWIFMKAWQGRFPNAKLYASPGLAGRKVVQDVRFEATLTDKTPAEYSDQIDQIIFETGLFDEVVFFHRESRTVLFCDMIQRFPEEEARGWKGLLMKLDGLVGENGTAPGELRCMYWLGGYLPAARKSLDYVLRLGPEKLVIAHGSCAKQNAAAVVANAFRWVPERPSDRICCCIPPRKKVVNENDSKDD
jgi:hypothetical protein